MSGAVIAIGGSILGLAVSFSGIVLELPTNFEQPVLARAMICFGLGFVLASVLAGAIIDIGSH